MKIIATLFLFASFFVSKAQEQIDTTYFVNGRSISLKSSDLGDFQIQLNYRNKNLQVPFDTLSDANSIGYFKFELFDNDVFPDLLICYLGNNPYYILYLYDSKTGVFKRIEDYFNFPDSKRLINRPEYYYSFHRSGCADSDWTSDFYKLENYRITQLGEIYGHGCEADVVNDPQYIKIYKISGSGELKIVETLN